MWYIICINIIGILVESYFIHTFIYSENKTYNAYIINKQKLDKIQDIINE